ncbi:MAG: hypothetical protein IJF05_04630 [Clostridia bacterium]|nr:hypothetical protein [Clostridia bacterium]
MKQGNCSVCLKAIDLDSAPVLTMGAYGTPRCLCDECAELIENFTRGRDYGEITAAMDELSAKMSRANIDDKITVDCITEMLVAGAKRASAIKDGSYDFSLDGEEEEYVIPDELRESEEDRALDEKEAIAKEKTDRVMNWVWLAVLLGTLTLGVLWYFGVIVL